MQHYWDVLEERDQGQLHIVIDKTWEDCSPRDLFDDTVYDLDEICGKIDSYDLDWFVLRARVFYEDIELGSSIVGGFLYEDARETLTDGTADDLIWTAMQDARARASDLKTKFMELEVEAIQ